jgi:hypothetical protein
MTSGEPEEVSTPLRHCTGLVLVFLCVTGRSGNVSALLLTVTQLAQHQQSSVPQM